MCELSNLQFVCWANSQIGMRVAVCEYVHGARCSTRSSKIRFFFLCTFFYCSLPQKFLSLVLPLLMLTLTPVYYPIASLWGERLMVVFVFAPSRASACNCTLLKMNKWTTGITFTSRCNIGKWTPLYDDVLFLCFHFISFCSSEKEMYGYSVFVRSLTQTHAHCSFSFFTFICVVCV